MSSITSGNMTERAPWLKILGLVLASRLLLFFIGLFTLYSHGREAHFDWSTWIEMTCRWDCGWYGEIINDGYSKGVSLQNSVTNWAFYPLLPLLVRMAQGLLGISDFRVAGMLLSSTAFIVALALIYRYARLLGNSERVAMTSVLIVAFLPQGIVFSATYTESLFLCLLAGTMLAMRQNQYLLAGICAALLSATRSNGIFIIVFIVVQLFLQLGPQGFFRPWRQPLAFLPLLMAPQYNMAGAGLGMFRYRMCRTRGNSVPMRVSGYWAVYLLPFAVYSCCVIAGALNSPYAASFSS